MSQARLFEMVYLLLERGKIPARELAERFEVSVRTVYRDVDALSAAGVPVYTLPGRNGGVALMEQYVLSKAALSEKEQDQLLTALRSLAGTPGLGGEEALSKFSALFRRSEPDWLQVDLSHWGNSAESDGKFQSLKEAILSHRVVTFTYMSSYGKTSRRRVLPLRLVFKGRAWYLQGFCLEKEAYRTFRISRLLELTVTDRVMAPPSAPPPDIQAPSAPFFVTLRLRFSPTAAHRVFDEFEESQVKRLPDGSLEATATFPEDDWVDGFLLSFGPGVEILEPARIRKRVGLLAKKAWEHCENYDAGCQGFSATMEASQTKEDATMNEMTFCQSCAMPLTDKVRGTEADGSLSPHYCKYCYDKGRFTGEMTMEEMIDFCAPIMAKSDPGMTEETAREQMKSFFPQLLRWKERK